MGSGTIQQCTDIPGWVESVTGVDYTCPSGANSGYGSAKDCEQYGGDTNANGVTANEACCICGGGNKVVTCHRILESQCPSSASPQSSFRRQIDPCTWVQECTPVCPKGTLRRDKPSQDGKAMPILEVYVLIYVCGGPGLAAVSQWILLLDSRCESFPMCPIWVSCLPHMS